MTSRPRGGRGLFLLLLCGTASVASAQLPADRMALRSLRDSLARTQDGAALEELARSALDVAKSRRDDPLPKLRLGFIDLRLAAVTASADRYNDAASEFEWAAQLRPEWPMVWLGRGFAELGSVELGSVIARVGQTVLGIDPVAMPARYIAHSAELDSSYLDGMLELGSLAFRQRSETQINVAMQAYRRLAGQPAAHDPRYLLARGRLEREVGDRDSALAALRLLVAKQPDDPLALLEFARTRYAAGSLEGEASWYRGLALADPQQYAEYRRDLDVLMPDSVLRALDAATGTERARVAQRFWASRIGAELNAGNERLREHYLRLDYVWHNFVIRPQASYDATPNETLEPAWFDDRGRIYLKHGSPDQTTSVAFVGAYDNESWRYRDEAGKDLLFHFLRPPGVPGYHSVESIFDIIGTTTAARFNGVVNPALELAGGKSIQTYGAGWLASTAQEVLGSRKYLSPIYGQILSEGRRGEAELQAAERAEGREALEAPDTWKMRYELDLGARVTMLAMRADSSVPAVQIAFALPGWNLFPRQTSFGFIHQVRVRGAIMSLAGEPVATVDVTKGYFSRTPLDRGQYLLGRVPVSVPEGTYRMQVAIESEGRGTVTAWDTIRVVAPVSTTLALSDLALGSRAVPLALQPERGDTAWVNPVGEFKRTDPLQLYFEVGGLPEGTRYIVELAVAEWHGSAIGKLLAGGGDALRFAFDETQRGVIRPIHRAIDLRRLSPGDYLLRVTVTTTGGEKVTRQRMFTVAK